MSSPPIHFIISAPRSGSTWLMNALNTHPEVFATEQRLFGGFAETWNNNNGQPAPRLTFDAYAKAFAMHYNFEELGFKRKAFQRRLQRQFIKMLARLAMKRKKGAKVIIDKITPYPGTSQVVIEEIQRFVPDAKVIQLVRDGRDVVTSGTFDWLLKDAEGSQRYEHFVNKHPDSKLARFFDNDVINKWASNWNETIEIFAQRPPDVQVRYESMKSDLKTELTKIYGLVGVGHDGSILANAETETDFAKVSGRNNNEEAPTSKVRKGVVGDWKNYFTQQDARLFNELAGANLHKLGYEVDDRWIAACPVNLQLSNQCN